MPSGLARASVVAAASIWIGALLGALIGLSLACAVVTASLVGATLVRNRLALVVVLVGVGAVSGAAAAHRQALTLAAAVPQGPGVVSGRAVSDGHPYGSGVRFVLQPSGWEPSGDSLMPWNGPRIAVVGDIEEISAGDQIAAEGLLRSLPGLVRGDPVAARLTASSVEIWGGADGVFMTAGNVFRARVTARLSQLGESPEAALLAGFLIGDTSGLSRPDQEALRRAGLTHFVAVSGSNVALVLGAWWLVVAPLGGGVRLRAVTGMLVLVVFVVATRWEASVIRAATMAALGLGGRVVGFPIDAWTALGGAVAILLTVSGDLAYDVGFQLSVVATAGVLAGMPLGVGRRPRLLWGALAATVSAQAAVVPLLLLHFGTVPLLAPVANLIAAPLVTAATAFAGAGVIVPWDLPLGAASLIGRAVLEVARLAGGWPQLGPVAAAATIGSVALAWRTSLRWVVVGTIVVAGLSTALPPGPPQDPTVTFLDVGQGDAVLLREPSGAAALVDGGREPAVLVDALRRYGVDRLDLVVATHGDADHVGGLVDLGESIRVGRFWAPADQRVSELLEGIMDAMESEGVPVDAVSAGDRARLGEFQLSVLGPQRRYATENDGSVVLWLESRGTSVLLPGDIGAIAQRDLGPLDPDVLLIPHHGAATTDLDWLTRTLGSLAVISVGRNSYGHPDPNVMGAIAGSASSVMTTLESGDVSIQLP